MRGKRALETIEAEIRKEKAEALGRVGECLEKCLQRLVILRSELLDLADGHPPQHGGESLSLDARNKLREYRELLDQAEELRYSLIIQREAVGLLRHEDVDRLYPLPEPPPVLIVGLG